MLAWGAGYAGGLAALARACSVLVLPKPPPFGLDRGAGRAGARLRAAGRPYGSPLFGWPVAGVRCPTADGAVPVAGRRCAEGMRTAGPLLRAAWADAALRRFLLARLFYMDGLITLFAFGGIYAAGPVRPGRQGVLLFGIGLNVTAGLGVLAVRCHRGPDRRQATMLGVVLALAGLGLALLLSHDRDAVLGAAA